MLVDVQDSGAGVDGGRGLTGAALRDYSVRHRDYSLKPESGDVTAPDQSARGASGDSCADWERNNDIAARTAPTQTAWTCSVLGGKQTSARRSISAAHKSVEVMSHTTGRSVRVQATQWRI
uniref:Uncharacterized protein n=1 Tax=Knipowitschia caucasica TaxID=637954 RepID=A0AAV2L1T2_KNICA